MEQTRTRYPYAVWLLSGLLCVLIVIIVVLSITLVQQRGKNSANAFATGRFVKVVVATGEMESMLPQSKGAAQTPIDAKDYKAQRLKQLTDAMPEPLPLPAPIVKQEEPSAITAEPDANKQNMEVQGIPLATRKVAFPLKPAPNPALIEKRTNGLSLPMQSADGTLVPWKEYAKPYDLPKESHLLSLVITNLGMNSELLKTAYALDERVTLAFSPYAPELNSKLKTARSAGFETWLNIPLQHENYPIHDYGPLTLLSAESSEYNMALLHQLLTNTDGIVGLIAMPDEQFSSSAQMATIFAELSRRGLLLTLYDPAFIPLANESMLLHARPHIYNATMPATIDAFFRQNELIASSAANTILTLAPMPAVMEQLNGWIATLAAKNIAVVPLSAQVVRTSANADADKPATAQGNAHE